MRFKPIPIRQTIANLAMVGLCMFVGFVSGFYAGTGMLPTFTQSKAIVPEEMSVTTLEATQSAIKGITLKDYEEGYNCVDFAWDAMRQLAWEGQPSAIVALDLEPDPNHSLLLVPTEDEGWVFIEPQAGVVVKPRVDGMYQGRKIVAIRVLKIVWIPIDEFIENPVFEEVKNE